MFNSVTIIGLGLIGGSMAKAIHERIPAMRIFAVDKCEDYIAAALKDGVISDGGGDITKELCRSDLIMICTPISTIPGIIKTVASLSDPDTLISDAASVNKFICDFADTVPGIRYVSTHPMAGSEKMGYFTAFSYLFENACTIISPCKNSDKKGVDDLFELYSAIGAMPIEVSPQRHDEAAAVISHLPHIVASALVNLLKESDTDGLAHKFAAGGFKGITRIASSTPEMWADISLKNSEPLLSTLDDLIDMLKIYRESIADDNADKLLSLLSSSKAERDDLSGSGGIIAPEYRLFVDVEDKVGATSRISGILTDAGISIKNIAVQNSREYEGGIMTLSLGSASETERACRLLNSNGISARIEK